MKGQIPKKVAEVQLIYKSKVKACDRPQILSSLDAHRILRENWGNQMELVEEFKILFLDRSNRVMGLYNLSKGGVESTVVDIKIIFAAALKARSSSIILAHNHPSQSLKPSELDIKMTKKIREAGELLTIKVLDHLILSPCGSYYSFADEGMI